MKTKYLILLFLLVCAITSKAENKTVTFDASVSVDRTDEKTLSKEGITISITAGSLSVTSNTGYYYRIASGNYITISSVVSKIATIIITYRQESTPAGFTLESGGGDWKDNYKKKTNAIWEGQSSAIRLYSSNTNNITSIAVTYDRSITMSSSTYATFWCERAYTMPTGLMGYTISGVEDGCVIKGQTYDAGSLVPANTPLMLRGNAGSYAYTTSDDDSPVPTPNLLRCSDGTEISEDGSILYKYTYLSSTDHTLGFFRHSDDGHTMKVDYGKAYLAIPDDGAAGAKSLTLNDNWDVTDGIERSVTAEECENDIEQTLYDIHGVVHPKAESLKEGIYITKTGRKIVVRK